MTLMVHRGVDELMSEALNEINSISVTEAIRLHKHNEAVFIDVREHHELELDGFIRESIHIPRGGLEYFVDPRSPKFNSVFNQDKHFIFYCAGGGRSPFATYTVKRMGLMNAYNLLGGFKAWKERESYVQP